MNNSNLLSVATEAALTAGKLAREKFYQPLQIANKGFRDYVTDADFAAQQVITSQIRGAFPDHGFLTEEDDNTLPTDGPILWVVDPIDGTTNYSRHIPLFCVSIAAVRNQPPLGTDQVLAAVIYDPMREELFSTAAGEEPQINGRPLQVSKTIELTPAIIGADWNRSGQLRQATLDTVKRMVHDIDGISIYHTAALALAWVAAGRIDGYFNFQLMPWDVAAASLLIHQAGGILSDAGGKPISLAGDRLACLASNGDLHNSLLHYMPEAL